VIFFVLVSLSILSQYTIAVESTQQYSKIYLNPFYRQSMSANTNYTYTINIEAPDKISKVNSAIISFNAQINGQTQNFTLNVNGASCNNPSFYIATAFSTTGNTQFYFDCSNRITTSGIYTITLSSAVNTGAVNGWIDLSYMNNPVGTMDISGTEYSPNDLATMFVQLQDNYGNAVQNGSCYIDIWYPLNLSNVHPYIIQDAPMIQALGDDGIYYYDMVAPSQLGVYMLSAKCSYTYNWQWIYPFSENVFYPKRTAVTGTWSGTEVVLNNPEDAIYDTCSSPSNCVANYTFNVSQYGVINNISTINLYWLGETTKSAVITFYYWNGTSNVALPNTITTVATGSTTQPSGIDSLQTNVVPSSAIINGLIKIQINEAVGSTHSYYGNWLGLAILSNYGTVQNVKGSSEMHITNIANSTSSLVALNIPQAVWNYTVRNLTYYQNFTVTQQDLTNYTRIKDNQYNYTPDFNNLNSTIVKSENAIIGNITQMNITLSQKMDTMFANISISLSNILSQFASIPSNVWSYFNRTLTYYPNMTVNTQVVNVQNTTLNLTVQNVSVSVSNYTINMTTYNQTVNNITVNVMNMTINTTTYNITVVNNTVNVQNITVNLTTENMTLINTSVTLSNYSIYLTTENVTLYNTSIIVSNYSIFVTTENVTLENTSIAVSNYSIFVTTENVTVHNISMILQNYSNNIITYNLTVDNVSVITQYVTVENVSVNTSKIVDDVWNYTARYVHGIII
jgi:hypothetical protein